jgi:hypothetical protein
LVFAFENGFKIPKIYKKPLVNNQTFFHMTLSLRKKKMKLYKILRGMIMLGAT